MRLACPRASDVVGFLPLRHRVVRAADQAIPNRKCMPHCPGFIFKAVKTPSSSSADFARERVPNATPSINANSRDLNLVELSRTLLLPRRGSDISKCIRRVQIIVNGSPGAHHRPGMSSTVWAKARDFRDRATERRKRARLEPDGDVQRPFLDVAQHYRILAEAEASNAGRLGNERRGQSETSQSGSRNGSIEVQALRLKLQLFASQQTDQTIRRQCHAVAEVIEGNHPTLRQVLANSVRQQLEEAVRRSTIREGKTVT